MNERVDEDDVQALLFQGYGNLRSACYVLFEIADAGAARAWLSSVAGDVTRGQRRPRERALNLALSASGLQRLGLPAQAHAAFSPEFQEGMTSTHRRRLLGDEREAAPERWAWGGPGMPDVNVLLLLFASTDEMLSALLAEHRSRAEAGGLRHITTLNTFDIGPVEHFGFRDTVSQPVLAGSARQVSPMHTIRAGEFLLGYLNEHGQYTDSPLVPPSADPHGLLPADVRGSGSRDLGKNGSYLVFRQLSQDVRAFWTFVDQHTRNPDESSSRAEQTRLAARMTGRWPSGAPMTLSPERDRPELAADNDFGYHAADREGLRCPIGAHVRRTNPRDFLPPRPGTQKSVDVVKGHRLIRRGRKYGLPLDRETALRMGAPTATDDVDRGLYFICVCANIARQFEFIQHTWCMNANFAGLYDDADPLLASSTNFTVQGKPVRQRIRGLPAFVMVRGGGYFFLPGIRATRYIAKLGR